MQLKYGIAAPGFLAHSVPDFDPFFTTKALGQGTA
jgi:hypothetical protein